MPMDYQKLEDSELAARAEEWEAFSELSRRYTELIRYMVGRFTDFTATEREDLAQEGFVGLFSAAKTFNKHKGAAFKTYASACIENQLISAARRYASQKNRALNTSLPLGEPEEAAAAAVFDREGNPQAVVEMKESFRQFDRQIREQLTELEYQALMLHFCGVKRMKIPLETGMTLKTYDNALQRVRRKLKNLSDKHSAE